MCYFTYVPTLAYKIPIHRLCELPPMATLKDIATACGVSIRTVTRALKENGYVAQPLKDRVRAEAQRLGYRPSRIARSLKTRQSFEVAVVLWNADELHLAKIAGLEHALRAHGYTVNILYASGRPGAEDDIPAPVEELLHHRPAAVAAFAGPRFDKQADGPRLEEASIPFVVFDVYDPGVDSVRVDRPQGVREAVLYLGRQGHQRIAYLGCAADVNRLQGYHAAMGELGLVPQLLELPDDRGRFDGAREFAATFARLEDRPTAVQAYSDETALGFLAGLQAQGVRVPEDVALVGFDNRMAAGWASPPLTTVAQPNWEVGQAAAEILLAKIAGTPPPAGGWSRSVPTRLVVRESA